MISYPVSISDTVTGGGFLLVLSIVLPVGGSLLAATVGGRRTEWIVLGTMPLGLGVAMAIAIAMRKSVSPLVYLLGGWLPPLGITLRADGLSVVMLAITAVVICTIGVFARSEFCMPVGSVEVRGPFAFWILLSAVWAALNTVFLGGDLFTLYVAVELLTFAAVPLVCLDGRGSTLQAALRYLLFALLGSALYLVGTALFYGTYGTLDIVLLSHRVHAGYATLIAAALMTVGLLAKTALFPLYLWLPPAHAGAPTPASAVLSGLVVKGSFFIVVRLWFNVMPSLPGPTAAQLLAGLGAAAMIFGSVLALRQDRLKLLIAYSTLAQIGYLFLMFPLALDPTGARLRSGGALTAGILHAISHATGKAAMFLAAGLIYTALGHDRIAGLAGIARALPISIVAFALGGIALVGVPPSGASLAKELLLQAAARKAIKTFVTGLPRPVADEFSTAAGAAADERAPHDRAAAPGGRSGQRRRRALGKHACSPDRHRHAGQHNDGKRAGDNGGKHRGRKVQGPAWAFRRYGHFGGAKACRSSQQKYAAQAAADRGFRQCHVDAAKAAIKNQPKHEEKCRSENRCAKPIARDDGLDCEAQE
jgi:multicomponent Na+:H+ antiporter subunit D